MFNNIKRVVIFAAVLVLLFTWEALSQTKVLNFQLGKSTYNEVKAKLPERVKVEQDDGKPSKLFGGPWFSTDGTGYGIPGLKGVTFGFDVKQTLVHVQMILQGQRLDDINKILSSKYQPVLSEYPDVFLLFKANCDYVYLRLPRDKDIVVEYMTGAVYRQEQLAVRRSAKDKMAREQREKREKQKVLEREAAKF